MRLVEFQHSGREAVVYVNPDQVLWVEPHHEGGAVLYFPWNGNQNKTESRVSTVYVDDEFEDVIRRLRSE